MWNRRGHFVPSKQTWKKKNETPALFKKFKRLLLWTQPSDFGYPRCVLCRTTQQGVREERKAGTVLVSDGLRGLVCRKQKAAQMPQDRGVLERKSSSRSCGWAGNIGKVLVSPPQVFSMISLCSTPHICSILNRDAFLLTSGHVHHRETHVNENATKDE